jgi:hypothetical protein
MLNKSTAPKAGPAEAARIAREVPSMPTSALPTQYMDFDHKVARLGQTRRGASSDLAGADCRSHQTKKKARLPLHL